MHLWQAVFLGAVEGITEFLPISSTGHLLLLQRVFGLGGAAHDAFAIVVQLGALLAAVLYYRRVWWQVGRGLYKKQKEAWGWTSRLLLASLPIWILGGLFGSVLKRHLYQPKWIVLALAVGGVGMILVEMGWQRKEGMGAGKEEHLLEKPTFSWKQACLIGSIQAVALWPGMSRSASCLMGGWLAGLNRKQTIDLAFLLALPALGAATLYEAIRHWAELLTLGVLPLMVGLCVSFVIGWLAIAGLLRFLGRVGLVPFGIYRLVLAGLVWSGTFW